MGIYLIDDNEIDRVVYKRIIRRSGLTLPILEFAGGDLALEYMKGAENEPADLILLDLHMPRMSGFDFLEMANGEIRSKIKEAVIIMLTTSRDPNDREKASRFDVISDYVNKPLTVPTVQNIATMLQ